MTGEQVFGPDSAILDEFCGPTVDVFRYRLFLSYPTDEDHIAGDRETHPVTLHRCRMVLHCSHRLGDCQYWSGVQICWSTGFP